jgi:hypothetical protein
MNEGRSTPARAEPTPVSMLEIYARQRTRTRRGNLQTRPNCAPTPLLRHFFAIFAWDESILAASGFTATPDFC